MLGGWTSICQLFWGSLWAIAISPISGMGILIDGMLLKTQKEKPGEDQTSQWNLMDRHAFAQMWHHRFDPSRYLIALQFQEPTSSNTSDLSRLGIQEYAGAVKDMRSRGLPMTCLLVFAWNRGTYIAKVPWSAQSQRWTKDGQLTRRSKRVDFDQQLQNWWAKLQDQCLAKVSAWTTIATTRAAAFSSRWRATRVMLHFMLLPLILTRDLLAAHLHPRGLPRWKRLGGRLHALQNGQACFVVGIEGEEVSVFKVILSQRLGQPESVR